MCVPLFRKRPSLIPAPKWICNNMSAMLSAYRVLLGNWRRWRRKWVLWHLVYLPIAIPLLCLMVAQTHHSFSSVLALEYVLPEPLCQTEGRDLGRDAAVWAFWVATRKYYWVSVLWVNRFRMLCSLTSRGDLGGLLKCATSAGENFSCWKRSSNSYDFVTRNNVRTLIFANTTSSGRMWSPREGLSVFFNLFFSKRC